MKSKDYILEVNNLSTTFFVDKKAGKAVDDVSFSLERGKILGLVGESGSGKSVTAMSIMRLLGKTKGRVTGGEVLFNGENLLNKNKRDMQRIRGKHISMVFQEPMTSLNPVLTIGDQITETLLQHEGITKEDAYIRAKELLEIVHIPFAEKRLHEYPHQLSGGMRQRVMIAMALSCNPELIIADEPTTALDVTIQLQILELFKELVEKYRMSVILITHDMGVIAEMADRVLVMYAGQVVEYGDVVSVLKKPLHPYTKALIKAIPRLDEDEQLLHAIPGSIPQLYDMPTGCHFNPRCAFATEQCRTERPIEKCEGEHICYCWNMNKSGGGSGGE